MKNAVSRRRVKAVNTALPHCFLITPFKPSLANKEARRGVDRAARAYGFPVLRVDELPGPSQIVDATHRHLASADFIVADLSGAKPNCYYEVGFARALERPIILVIRGRERPHFNLAGLPFVLYDDAQDLFEKLSRHIYTDVLTTQSRQAQGDNAQKYGGHAFEHPYRVTGRVRVDPDLTNERHGFLVNVRVDSIDPRQPVAGDVIFHLHSDFRFPTERLNVRDGHAELLSIPATETFTIGVEIVEPGVQLELDLARIPGATSAFRSRY